MTVISTAKRMLKKVDAKEEDRKEELKAIRKQNTKVSIFFGGNVGGLQRARAGSIKEILDTNRIFGRDFTWAVIAPDSQWKSKWDYLIIIFVLYNSLFIPFSFSFLQTRNSMVEIFDYFVDFMFLIDMGLSFFTGFYDNRGDEVVDLKEIRVKYFSRWFWIDLVAVFPFEVLILASGKNLNVSVFNLFKAPRLLRLGKLAKKLDQMAGANAFRIFKLLLVFTLFAHWVACVWFFVGRFQDEGNLWSGSVWLAENHLCQTVKGPGALVDGAYISVPADEVGTAYMVEGVLACIKGGAYGTTEHRSWEVQDQLYLANSTKCPAAALPEFPFYCNNGVSHVKPSASVFTQYITSFYWALSTLTTIGYGDVTPSTNSERSFVVVIMLFGAILYASIFGNVAVLIQNFDAQHARYSKKLNQMNEYATFYTFDMQTYDRLLNYTAQHQSMGASIDMRTMLQDFPNSLKGDVAMMVHTDFVNAFKRRILPMRDEKNSNFLRAMAIQLRNVVILKGDYVFFKGEVNKETYYMSKGYIGLAFDVDNSRKRIDHYGRSRGFTADGKSLKSTKSTKWGKVAGVLGRLRGSTISKQGTNDEDEQDVKVSILTSGDTFGNLDPWSKTVKKCSYDALAITKCELFSLPYFELVELSKDYKPEMNIMCDYAKENLQLKRESEKSFLDVDPHEVHENVQRRYSKKKKDMDELAKIELSLDMNGGIEDVEERMSSVETKVLDRLGLLEERVMNALLKKRSMY
ncbi:potassium voltage-gated channel protein [Chloropicon primus]|uniref:Potassium voltage-gated channel protein n=1 Tax=Chloropicon primus TaxID=1764295 RepID=A0A5B8MPQ6_9CHLO|nr:potassium voltage-gated channel protein [Chloropicon primus]UPR01710.1 potassium voltage-gated channel protein [Chloropicon primus]|eukprot:QDZ22489.1 potassium voltage-gated channel protein [Chloropicon primus]